MMRCKRNRFTASNQLNVGQTRAAHKHEIKLAKTGTRGRSHGVNAWTSVRHRLLLWNSRKGVGNAETLGNAQLQKKFPVRTETRRFHTRPEDMFTYDVLLPRE